MNERIQELMKQSMEPSGLEGLGGPYMELNPEKFAELIAKECCDLMQGFTFEKIATRVIKKNFGIEE